MEFSYKLKKTHDDDDDDKKINFQLKFINSILSFFHFFLPANIDIDITITIIIIILQIFFFLYLILYTSTMLFMYNKFILCSSVTLQKYFIYLLLSCTSIKGNQTLTQNKRQMKMKMEMKMKMKRKYKVNSSFGLMVHWVSVQFSFSRVFLTLITYEGIYTF